MELLLAYLFFSVLVAAYANLIKRSGLVWLLISLFISPLIAFIVLVIMGRPTLPGFFGGLGMKTCPHCAEKVKRAAKVCRFCGHELTTVEPQTQDSIKPIAWENRTEIAPTGRFKTREEYESWRDETLKP